MTSRSPTAVLSYQAGPDHTPHRRVESLEADKLIPPQKGHVVGFWNPENLFAPEDFAGREPWIAEEMTGDPHGWTEQLFDRTTHCHRQQG